MQEIVAGAGCGGSCEDCCEDKSMRISAGSFVGSVVLTELVVAVSYHSEVDGSVRCVLESVPGACCGGCCEGCCEGKSMRIYACPFGGSVPGA